MSKQFQQALLMSAAVIGLGGGVFAAAPAMAQSAPADDEAAAPAAGEIVVTAQRRSEALEKTPVAVAVVSAEALAKQAITSER
ncbi:MAG: hypothetical protein ACKOQ3_13360, partial [Novosphingobium sp.]